MLYKTAARASEILSLDVADLDLDARRAAIVSKGGSTEYVYWGHRDRPPSSPPPPWPGRRAGLPLPAPTRAGPWPGDQGPCPETGRARLGYDRARILLDRYTSPGPGISGWDLHQLRHSAATHLGEGNVGLQLIMANTRHRNPRTAMRHVKPGGVPVAEVTELLDIAPRRR